MINFFFYLYFYLNKLGNYQDIFIVKGLFTLNQVRFLAFYKKKFGHPCFRDYTLFFFVFFNTQTPTLHARGSRKGQV